MDTPRFLEILARIKELRMSNNLTKEMFPEAVVGDLWIDTIDQLLIHFGLSESERRLFWIITEP
jgi:hypothetical protein